MKLAPARQAAFAALLSVSRGAWSAESLAAKSTHLEPRDAALASDIVYGVLRRRGELDAVIARFSRLPLPKLDPAVKIALEMAIYQLRFLDRIPAHAAVNDAVELVRRAGKESAAAFTNAILRKIIQDQTAQDSVKLAVPAWLSEGWRRNTARRLPAESQVPRSKLPAAIFVSATANRRLAHYRPTLPDAFCFPKETQPAIAFRTLARSRSSPCLTCARG